MKTNNISFINISLFIALLNKSKIFIFWHYSPVGGDKDARKEKMEGDNF